MNPLKNPAFYILALFLLVGVLFAKSCRAAEWDTADKALFGALVVEQGIDILQTNKALRRPEQYREANPIYGPHPNIGTVIAAKVAVTAGIGWIADGLTPQQRKILLGVVDAVQLSVVAHNYQVGLKFGF